MYLLSDLIAEVFSMERDDNTAHVFLVLASLMVVMTSCTTLYSGFLRGDGREQLEGGIYMALGGSVLLLRLHALADGDDEPSAPPPPMPWYVMPMIVGLYGAAAAAVSRLSQRV